MNEVQSESPRPSVEWVAYFRDNARSLLEIPWERGEELSEAERWAITRSVQAFQLGESSEGRHFLGRVRDHACRQDDPAYAVAAALFIAEEHRHARDLGRFLRLNRIDPIGRTWTDSVFRGLRRLAGLELSIVVLITAEVIAKVYYAALREATHSTVLHRLCDQILRDEEAHVRFQAERIALLRRGRSRVRVRTSAALHRIFFAGTCAVVWWDHGRAMRAGGYPFGRFWRASWREFEEAISRMDPDRVRIDEPLALAFAAEATS